MPTFQRSVEVNVPVRTAYNQWTQFEEFPRFMDSVREVRQLDDTHLHWCVEADGRQIEWDAEITEQVPDQCIAWQATNGPRASARVQFKPLDESSTTVTLTMDVPGGKGGKQQQPDLTAKAGEDLERFAEFVEQQGHETGAWRGEVRGGQEVRGDDRPRRSDDAEGSQAQTPSQLRAQAGGDMARQFNEKLNENLNQGMQAATDAVNETMRQSGEAFQRNLDTMMRFSPLGLRGQAGSVGPTGIPSTLFSSMLTAFEEPFSIMRRFTEQLDREMETFMWGPPGTARRSLAARTAPMWSPSVDVAQQGQELVVTADLPGVSPEDLDVQINEGHLVIAGERRSEATRTDQGVQVMERTCGRFMRAIPLPEGVQASEAQARMHEGVLEVRLQMPAERRRRIEVKAGQRQGQGSDQQGGQQGQNQATSQAPRQGAQQGQGQS